MLGDVYRYDVSIMGAGNVYHRDQLPALLGAWPSCQSSATSKRRDQTNPSPTRSPLSFSQTLVRYHLPIVREPALYDELLEHEHAHRHSDVLDGFLDITLTTWPCHRVLHGEAFGYWEGSFWRNWMEPSKSPALIFGVLSRNTNTFKLNNNSYKHTPTHNDIADVDSRITICK